MEQEIYADRLPTEPPKGLVQWLLQKGELEKELLIYRASTYYEPLEDCRHRCVEICCTACGKKVKVTRAEASGAPFGFIHPNTNDALESGDCCFCPECGAEVEVRHVSSAESKWSGQNAWPMTIGRIDKKLVLYGWLVQKTFRKNGDKVIESSPYEAYVVEDKKIVRLKGYHRCLNSLRLLGNWEQLKGFYDEWETADLVYPWDAILLEGSTTEKSKLDVFMANGNASPISYLRVWQKHQNIENLVMQGASVLIQNMMCYEGIGCNAIGYRKIPKLPAINWKENKPSKMLGLTKEEFRRCLKENWDSEMLQFYKKERSHNRKPTAEEVNLCKRIGLRYCEEIAEQEGINPAKAARYLDRQKKANRCDAIILLDYWRMARDIGQDTSLDSVRWPKNLTVAHDKVANLQELEHNAERSHKIKVRSQELQRFVWEKDGILIRPAEGAYELIREGDLLNHCVGSYATDVADGRKTIFFIRRVEEPDKPWYTLELNLKDLTVVQNRGHGNCARTEEIKKFEKEWLTWCHKQEKSKRKECAA